LRELQLSPSRRNVGSGTLSATRGAAPMNALVGQISQPVVSPSVSRPGSARPGSASIFRSQIPRSEHKKIPVHVGVAFPSDDAFADKHPQGRPRHPSGTPPLCEGIGQMRISQKGSDQPVAAGRPSGIVLRQSSGYKPRSANADLLGQSETDQKPNGRGNRSNCSSIPGGIFG